MPPKAKYTGEQIIDAAYEMVRRYGEDMLSARNLAADLGTSTSPIFAAFDSIDEIARSVGFESPSYFSKYFKECFGTSPLKYRTGKVLPPQ